MINFLRGWVYCAIGLTLLHGSRTTSAEKAERAFQRSLKLVPTNSKATVGLGLAHFRLGRHGEATQLLEDFVEKHPDDARGLFELAKLRATVGESEGAKDLLERARVLASNNAIKHNLGLAFEDLGMDDQALECYRRGAKSGKASASIHLRLGYLLNKRGDYVEAIEAYQKCIKKDPRALFGHIGLGHSFIKIGEFEKGRKAYAEAVRVDPQCEQASDGVKYAQLMLEKDGLD